MFRAPAFIEKKIMLRGRGRVGGGAETAMVVEKKKSLVRVITATRCSHSVIQRKETEEEEVVKKKEK